MAGRRCYVVVSSTWPGDGSRARSFETAEAARKAAAKLANDTGRPYFVEFRPRNSASRGWREEIRPSWQRDRDLHADVDLAHGIGIET